MEIDQKLQKNHWKLSNDSIKMCKGVNIIDQIPWKNIENY